MHFARAAVLFSALAALTLAEDAPIKCYQCNSSIEGEKDCLDLLDKDPATMLHPEPCNMSVYGPTPFCRKTILLVYRAKGDHERRTYRGCGQIKDDKPCYRSANGDHMEKTCQCFEEGCNSAFLGASISNINIAVTLLIGFFLSYFYK